MLIGVADQRGGPFRLAAGQNARCWSVSIGTTARPVHRRETCIGQMSAQSLKHGRHYAVTSLFKVLCAGLGLILVTVSASSAQTARNCAPRTDVVERLASKYGESRQSMGLGANNAVVEVFASAESGSWTITVTTPAGMTCLVASGQHFEELAEALPPEGDGA